MIGERHPASFRDRDGYIVKNNNVVYRQITRYGLQDYRSLIDSGLYAQLSGDGEIVSHEEIPSAESSDDGVLLLPHQVSFISYPYEWCFSQLKDAALLVLRVQERALAKEMSLKDASAYNVQFVNGCPQLIDTSSFERYREGEPWIAYRQFCEHFLSPLLLMCRLDVRLGSLQGEYIDGIPVDLAASLVRRSTWLNPWLYMHVGLHGKAKAKRSYADRGQGGKMSKAALLGLINSLRKAIESLNWSLPETTWGDYSSSTSYDQGSAREKHRLVEQYLAEITPSPSQVWDLGANAGEFSRIASNGGICTVAWDGDPVAVERNYRAVRANRETNLLPLLQDFVNPSPGLGWEGTERASFFDRGPADAAFALALIHHIVIGNSVPMEGAVHFFARTARWLVIEFVGLEDAKVIQLLSSRATHHPYDQAIFEDAFKSRFEIVRCDPVGGSRRSLYLMRLRS